MSMLQTANFSEVKFLSCTILTVYGNIWLPNTRKLIFGDTFFLMNYKSMLTIITLFIISQNRGNTKIVLKDFFSGKIVQFIRKYH
jgi:hypothetical protein